MTAASAKERAGRPRERDFSEAVEAVLRAKPWLVAEVDREERAKRLKLLLLIVAFGAGAYGLAMGSFAGHPLQMLLSGIKTPALLIVSAVLALPSFYVFHAVLGVRDDFGAALRAIAASQAAVALVLGSIAPLTIVWYTSFNDYDVALAFNLVVFAIGSLTAQRVLVRFYEPLVQANPTHLKLRRLWLGLYAFIAIQMAWVLRPFVGAPNQPVQVFRDTAWGNAYLELWDLFMRMVG